MFVRSIGSDVKTGPVRSGLWSQIGLALISVQIGTTTNFDRPRKMKCAQSSETGFHQVSRLATHFWGVNFCSKFYIFEKCETLDGCLPSEDASARPQTLGKRGSDDSRRFIFRCQKFVFGDFVFDFSTILRVLIETQEMSCLEHKKCLDRNTRYVLIGTREMS